MTCDDYLAMLETLPVEELTHGEARNHAAVCHDCNRVTRVVAERERNMLMAYGDVMPSAFASDVATSAIASARRRRLALVYRIALGIAAVATVGFVGASRSIARVRRSVARERFAMRCLSTGRAERLLRSRVPGIASSRIRRYEPDGILEVQAAPRTIQAARAVLDEYNDQCVVMPMMPEMPAMPVMPAMPATPAVPAVAPPAAPRELPVRR